MRFTTSITIDDKAVIINVPKGTAAWRKANAIFCPLGPAPTQGWFVMLWSDLKGLDVNKPHTVTWTQQQTDDDPDDPSNDITTLSFPGLYITNAERLLHGGPGDNNALYLVELADARMIAAKNSDCGVLNVNIRSYANSADFLSGTTAFGTWEYLVEQLWNNCGTVTNTDGTTSPLLGGYPGLPAAFDPLTMLGMPIDGAPNNTFLIGLNSWRSLTAVLEQLDCAVVRDPLAGTFSIVQLGSPQNIIPAGYADTLKWNGEPLTGKVTQAAANLHFYHYYHYKSYGQERDAELANNWAVNAGGPADTATGITGAAGTQALWDDLPLILDENGQVFNQSDVDTRDANRLTRYVTRWSVTNQHRMHWGLRTDYIPGGQVRAVLWRNWNDGAESPFGGTVTEFICCPQLICGCAGGIGDGPAWFDAQLVAPEREQYAPPDVGRHSYPNYPRLPNVVQVVHGSGDVGTTVAPDQANDAGVLFHGGFVKRFVAGQMATMDPCWILFIDDYETKAGNVTASQADYYGPARLSGQTTCGGIQLPVYVCRKGSGTNQAGDLVVFELTTDSAPTEPVLDLAGSSLAVLCSLDNATGLYSATATAITVVDFYRNPGEWQGMVGLRGIAKKRTDRIGGRDAYDIVWMERPALLTYGLLDTNETAGVASINQSSANLFHFQQGEKPPPNIAQLIDPGLLFPRALGPNARTVGSLQVFSPAGKFLAVWNDRRKQLEPLVAQQQCFTCFGKLAANLKKDDPTLFVRDIRVDNFSPFNLTPPQLNNEEILCTNDLNLMGLKGDPVVITWRESIESWLIAFVGNEWMRSGLVKVQDPTASSGLIEVDGDFLSGVFCYDSAPASRGVIEGFQCYVDFVDFDFFPDTKLIVENNRVYGPAKLIGFNDDDNMPIYQCCVGEQEWEVTRATDLAKGTPGTFNVLDGDGDDSGIEITANPKWQKFSANKKGIAKRMSGKLVVNQMCGT